MFGILSLGTQNYLARESTLPVKIDLNKKFFDKKKTNVAAPLIASAFDQ